MSAEVCALASARPALREPGFAVFARSRRDAWLLAGAGLYGLALGAALAWPLGGWGGRGACVLGLAVGLVWVSNTISHLHLHAPLFRHPAANRAFELALTLLLGIPQRAWKRRHLRHHGIVPDDDVATRSLARDGLELGALLLAWTTLAVLAPATFFATLLPAWALGLGLCAVQGHYEHAGGDDTGVDYHGRLYNRLWFNDGHHRAHHADPRAHWTTLARHDIAGDPAADPRPSVFPPLLRWLDRRFGLPAMARAVIPTALDALERVALRSRALRGMLLATHGPALRALVAALGAPGPRRVCIVGGGMFPRTAILLGRLLPHAELILLDASAESLSAARRVLLGAGAAIVPRPERITFVHAHLDDSAEPPEFFAGAPVDLLVVPLALRGRRARFYAARPGCAVAVHDWLWRRRGDRGWVIAPWLLKRVNLVTARPAASFSVAPLEPRGLDTLAGALPAKAEPSCRTPPPRTPLPALSTERSSRASVAAIARRF